ncbi:putative phage abortive infection protein [Aeromonas dhakensis]|uniref:putative phage abortive infection protein n=1 Tax=Aeromonas dhakensis TaxID=196024 RepID=UPI002447092B|nr:putative phage abortive infection protein [Aeromonas dhakensis]MDH0348700.1 putative phage abortive infection protein [Aeromonas dhakensis]
MNISGWSILLIGILAFVFSVWMYYPDLILYFQARSYVTENTGLGEFGDMYGSLNTLFSGLAFSAVVVTLLLQKQQLSISQQELRLTREEMSSQSDLFAIQTQVMNQQLFEGTFFQLLKLYLEQSSTYSEMNSDTNRSKWTTIYNIVRRTIDVRPRKDLDYPAYDKLMDYGVVATSLNPISFLLNILKYVDESSLISSEKKWFYVELLKHNVSGVEKYLVAVFSAYDEKLNPYQSHLEKYSFFDGLDIMYPIPLNVFCDYKMDAYLSLRSDIFEIYIHAIIHAGFYSGIYSFDKGEMICSLQEALESSTREKYFNGYECVIK